MRKFILALFVFIIIAFAAQAQNTMLPQELKPFIQKGYEVLDFVKNDMNSDKLMDYILILKVQGEDTMTIDNSNWDAPRPLLLIIRQPDKSLKLRTNNSVLVLCKQCGGMMGDPYQGVRVKPGEFTTDFYGGSSWRWSESYTFRYDKIKKDWFLELHNSINYHVSDPNDESGDYHINRSEIGDVTLKDFSPYYNTDSSTWKVNVAKTYFYASPAIKSKPKTAYLVKGNTVQSYKRFKNFIQCSFTNSKGKITSGFILKKDLLLVPVNFQKGG